jgi:hypothetical protein
MKISSAPVSPSAAAEAADQLEKAIGKVMNGEAKPGALPVEPLCKLIQFVRDHVSVASADVGHVAAGDELHAPAPWHGNDQFVELEHGMHPVMYVKSNSEIVAQLWLTGCDLGLSQEARVEQTRANFYLIKNSPKLVEALKAVKELAKHGQREGNFLGDIERISNTAIASVRVPAKERQRPELKTMNDAPLPLVPAAAQSKAAKH